MTTKGIGITFWLLLILAPLRLDSVVVEVVETKKQNETPVVSISTQEDQYGNTTIQQGGVTTSTPAASCSFQPETTTQPPGIPYCSCSGSICMDRLNPDCLRALACAAQANVETCPSCGPMCSWTQN